jgi:IS5 family transposase
MLRVVLCQLSMMAVDPDRIGLEPDSFERHLPGLLPRLVPAEDLRRVWTASDGAPTCCALQMVGMLLLQFRYNLSESELYRRCTRDLGFRCALGLDAEDRPPSPSSLRRFRKRLFESLGDDYLFQLSLRLAKAEGLIEDADLQALDSTPTRCRGAVIDTFNLVAAAIRQVVRQVARCLGREAKELAQEWQLGRYMSRSVKGAAGIDWDDESQRNKLLTEEIRDADRLAQQVEQLQAKAKLPDCIDEALRLLAQVARQDVEELDDGMFRIAKGTVPGRVISISDPEARHGRKSRSKVIKGFKTHVIGTLDSQFVTGIAITDAATHDAQPTPELVGQAAASDLKPSEAVGDNAYGTGANLRACEQDGVQLHTKPGRPASRGALSKRDFDIDLEAMTVTCPAGQTTDHCTLIKGTDGSDARVPLFHFPKDTCQQCPLKDSCCSATAKGGHRTVPLSSYEHELQKNRDFSRTDRGQEVLRNRSAVERLIAHLVRMGMRHARFFGMKMTQMQAYMIAAAYNLQRAMTLLVARAAAST